MNIKSAGPTGEGPAGKPQVPAFARPPRFSWPPPVKPGDVVAVAAPASPISRPAWEAGMDILKGWGFRVHCGQEVFQKRPWGVETDRRLARRLQEVWLNPEVKAVIGARGGYGSLKLLPHLELSALQGHPKRLVGFSDLTNLLWEVHRKLGLVTFHGPTVAHLAALTPAALEDFYLWLTAPGPRDVTYPDLTVLHPGAATGPLAGGNLTTLCHLVGTPFAPQLKGYLLFLEDHNEALYRLDRMLHHLWLSGVLGGVRGVVLGAFTGCGSSADGLLEVMGKALAPLQIPVLSGLPVGHQAANHTLPLGAWARLDGDAAGLTLLSDGGGNEARAPGAP